MSLSIVLSLKVVDQRKVLFLDINTQYTDSVTEEVRLVGHMSLHDQAKETGMT